MVTRQTVPAGHPLAVNDVETGITINKVNV